MVMRSKVKVLKVEEFTCKVSLTYFNMIKLRLTSSDDEIILINLTVAKGLIRQNSILIC